jgi:hypothetical protein
MLAITALILTAFVSTAGISMIVLLGGDIVQAAVGLFSTWLHAALFIPKDFRKDFRKKPTWTPMQQSGKLIEFCLEPKKSA